MNQGKMYQALWWHMYQRLMRSAAGICILCWESQMWNIASKWGSCCSPTTAKTVLYQGYKSWCFLMYSYGELRSAHWLYTDRDDQFVCHCVSSWRYWTQSSGVIMEWKTYLSPVMYWLLPFCVPAGQLNCSRLYQGLVALHICCSIAQSNHRPKPGSIKSDNQWPSQAADVKHQCCMATAGELYEKRSHCVVPQVAVTWMNDIKSKCGKLNAHVISWVEKQAEISGKSTVDCAVEQYVFELKVPSKRPRLQWCICLDNCAMNF